MSNKITIEVTLKITVDVDAWAHTYGLSVNTAEVDACNYVPQLVRDAVGELPQVSTEHTLTLEE